MKRSLARLGRTYEISGDRYPSVTTVLGILDKPGLGPWAVKVALQHVRKVLLEKPKDGTTSSPLDISPAWIDPILESAANTPIQIRDDAADLGTRVHELLEKYVDGTENASTVMQQADEDTRCMIEGFVNWHQQSGLRLEMGEHMVVSHRYKYAGRIDMVARLGTKAYVLDVKTSSMVHPTYSMQLAAYAHAIREMGSLDEDGKEPIEAVDALVLHLDRRTGVATEYHVGDMELAFNGFKSALFLWRILQNKGQETAIPDNVWNRAAPSLLCEKKSGTEPTQTAPSIDHSERS